MFVPLRWKKSSPFHVLDIPPPILKLSSHILPPEKPYEDFRLNLSPPRPGPSQYPNLPSLSLVLDGDDSPFSSGHCHIILLSKVEPFSIPGSASRESFFPSFRPSFLSPSLFLGYFCPLLMEGPFLIPSLFFLIPPYNGTFFFPRRIPRPFPGPTPLPPNRHPSPNGPTFLQLFLTAPPVLL